MIMTESTTKKMSKTMKENNDNDGQNYEEDVEDNVNNDNDGTARTRKKTSRQCKW